MSEIPSHPHSPENPSGKDYVEYPIENAMRRVSVRRTGGEIEPGWLVVGETTDGERYVVERYDEESGGSLEKRVSKQALDALQNEIAANRPERREAFGNHPGVQQEIGRAAIRGEVELPQTLSERVEAGWAVPRQELIDAGVVTPAETSPEDVAEALRKQRLHQVFDFPDASTPDKYGSSKRMLVEVTEQSQRDGEVAFMSATHDEHVKAIFEKYNDGQYVPSKMASELLRTNNELRVELGAYFLDKLAAMHYLPERVMYNSSKNLKNPNVGGYGDKRFTSREYAALLAVSMLDGTFKTESTKHDPIYKNRYSEVVTGQHRYAAHMLLETERYANVEQEK